MAVWAPPGKRKKEVSGLYASWFKTPGSLWSPRVGWGMAVSVIPARKRASNCYARPVVILRRDYSVTRRPGSRVLSKP